MQEHWIAVSIITLLLYHPVLIVIKVLDVQHMAREARRLNPADAHKIKGPFGWRWAAKCIYLRYDCPPLRTRWYVYEGTGRWQVWEYEHHV